MKIQIVIPCINLWKKYTKPCIASVQTEHEYRILLIDNASSDETKREAERLQSANFAYQRNEEPWSCAKSWNFGVKDAWERGFDYVVVLNNDVLLHPKAIDILVNRFESQVLGTPTALAMATMNDVRGECPIIADIFTLSVSDKQAVEESEHPCFSGFMINKECWDRVGEFDENFKPAYFEDNDYHRRINIAGMKAIVVPSAMFYHFGNGTQREAIPGRWVTSGFQFEKNREYYKSKWGGLPGEETFQKPFNEV